MLGVFVVLAFAALAGLVALPTGAPIRDKALHVEAQLGLLGALSCHGGAWLPGGDRR